MARFVKSLSRCGAVLAALALVACAAPQTARSPTGAGEFRGMRPSDVVGLLGEPDLRRSEPPGEIWQYRATDCVLDLFFYDAADGYRVTDAETHARVYDGVSACRDADAPLRAHLARTPL